MKQYVLQLLQGVLAEFQADGRLVNLPSVEVSVPELSHGDYSTNIAMKLAKELKQNPNAIAEELALKLIEADNVKDKNFSNIKAVGGFINFSLSPKYLKSLLENINSQKENFGSSSIGDNEKVLVEYFQPNMAKPLHLGHIRTAVIGDALFRILKFSGFNVESDTHLGDWGTQFGLLLLAYKKWGDIAVIEKDPIVELNKLYVKINLEIENSPELLEQGKAEFVKLEQGDSENTEHWKKFKEWSWQEYSIIYDELGVRKSDNDWPESFFADKMPAVLEDLKAKKLLVESQGAQIVDLSEYNLGVAVVVKSDGGTTYLLRDLATYIFRKSQGFAKQMYVVDNRQSHTLNQTFKILELAGYITEPQEAIHISYGFLSLPEGAMSTRKGTIIGAKELIKRAEELALGIINEKNPDLVNKEEVSKVVAQGAIKYFDLSHNYKTDIVFSWDKALSFDGNTGPYLQYTHARIYGIWRKMSQSFPEQNTEAEISEEHGIEGFTQELNEYETTVIRKLHQFPQIIESVAIQYTPNTLCNYLFELSQHFNSFYQEVPILKEPDGQKRAFRHNLIKATSQVLKNGLNLLGIEAPEQM